MKKEGSLGDSALYGENTQKAAPAPAPAPAPVPVPLTKDICLEVAKHVHESEALGVALICKGFRDAMKEVLLKARKKKKTTTKRASTSNQGDVWLKTSRKHFEKGNVPVSEEWIKWAFSMKWECAGDHTKHRVHKERLLVNLAARGGYKDVLDWLKSEGCAFDSDTSKAAAAGGHVKVLKYLQSEGTSCLNPATCNAAARGGHIKVLKYLKIEGVSFNEWTCMSAAEGGHIDVLKYLKREGVKFNSQISVCAAGAGQIEVLKYLKSKKVTLNEDTCLAYAAKKGHLGVLKYFETEGVRLDQRTCWAAAEGGQIGVLKYLKSEGLASFDKKTCKIALNLFIDSLNFAMVNKNIQIVVQHQGPLQVLKYLRSEGVFFDQEMYSALRDRGQDTEILMCILGLGSAATFYCLEGGTKRELTNSEVEEVKSFLPLDQPLDEEDIYAAMMGGF